MLHDGAAYQGEGFSIDQSAIECNASAGGVFYSFAVDMQGSVPTTALLSIGGASFCSSDCSIAYLASAPCAVQVTTDEGVGGRFVADVECHGMHIPGDAAGAVDVTVSIDGTHRPPPLPG
jgi:hypothetical protein